MATVNNNIENLNVVENNKKEEVMNKKLNLLFIEGNRTEINKANVVESYNKIKAYGFIETMPIEYFPMQEVKDKLGDRVLYKPTLIRKSGEGEPIISNFEIQLIAVSPEEYDSYDGICGDGQHRTMAMMFSDLKDEEVTYQEVKLPREDMDILTYISMRNNGRKWTNDDFYASHIATGNTYADYILNKKKEKDYNKVVPAFLFNIYTLGTATLTPTQIKSLQQGYKKMSDFGKVQINKDTQERGDKILKALKDNEFLTSDRFTGRFGAGLKAFYTDCGNINKVVKTISLINKDIWEKHFTPASGQSMEAKSYKEALAKLAGQVKE